MNKPRGKQGWVGRGTLRCNRQVFLGETLSQPCQSGFWGLENCFLAEGKAASPPSRWSQPQRAGCGLVPLGRGAAGAGSRHRPPPPPASRGRYRQPGGDTAVPCCHLTGRGLPAAGRAGEGENPFPGALLPRGVQVPRGLHPPRSGRTRRGKGSITRWGEGTRASAVRGN